VAAELGDDAVHGGQAQAGAFALGLGGEERLERPVDDVLGHPGAGVADFQADVPPRRQPDAAGSMVRVDTLAGGGDDQLPACGHGVAGVDGQVDEDLLDLARVG